MQRMMLVRTAALVIAALPVGVGASSPVIAALRFQTAPGDSGVPKLWEDVSAKAQVPGGDSAVSGDDGIDWTCEESPVRAARTTPYSDGQYRFSYYDGLTWRYEPSTGRTWLRVHKTCSAPGHTTWSDTWWQLQGDPDPRVLIDPAVDAATERVYAPQPSLSPPTRGVVNLGMWLAVIDQGPVTAEARASDTTWARATATLRATTFDFGNGDVVTCEGAGTPIPDSAIESIDEGPCGYTYREVRDMPYTVTITSTWTVVATTSAGAIEQRDDIVLTTTVDYDVIEIQTVGVSG